jgi:hypothetical protein
VPSSRRSHTAAAIVRGELSPRRLMGALAVLAEGRRPAERHHGPHLNAHPRPAKTSGMADSKRSLTEGQRAYEARRAAKAGMSLDKWLDSKERQQKAAVRTREKAAVAAKTPKKPGFFSRLLERVHKPL